MDLKNINDLWARFDVSGATEMELEMQGVRFHLKKENVSCQELRTGSVKKENDLKEKEQAEKGNHPMNSERDRGEAGKTVKAPLVGTFYKAPSPEDKPFVEVGKEIHKGDVIGIIEAMKLMNEVTAAVDGVVKENRGADGDMVEYGQILITLD